MILGYQVLMENYTGENIKILLRAMGISSKKLEIQTGVAKHRIDSWGRTNGKKANPKDADLEKLSNYFGVSRGTLREKVLSLSEVETILNKMQERSISQQAIQKHNRYSEIHQTAGNGERLQQLETENEYLKKILEEKERLITILLNKS